MKIVVSTAVTAPMHVVWQSYTTPEDIKAWIAAQPTHIEGRRQMPQFNFTPEQLDDLTEFLRWTGEINTENWPPNIEG